MSWPEIKHKLAAAPTFGCRLTANLWVQSALAATLWFQRANYSQTAPLKTKGVLTSRGQVMVPNAAKLWV